MTDLATIIPAGLALFGGGWGGQAILAWLKGRSDATARQSDNEVRLSEHSDKIMFEVLEAARAEARMAREDARLVREESDAKRDLEARFAHFEEAIDHIIALRSAHENEAEWLVVSRAAENFVNRMRRLADARGTLANEAQRLSSALTIAERAARKGVNP